MDINNRLRPQNFKDFLGQKRSLSNLKVFIDAAKERKEALDHILLSGPPGLGKTTLARITAREAGVALRVSSGPAIKRGGDLAAILTNLREDDVLFIDEIHRLNPAVEEVLYPAMEDFRLDLIVGEGAAARSISIPLKRFTLIGATTRSGLVTRPLRERFGIPLSFGFYEAEPLMKIVERAAIILRVSLDAAAAHLIAERSRGTPRTAVRLLKRIVDFLTVKRADKITVELASSSLEEMGIDQLGLNETDRNYLRIIAESYGGGPVGADTLSVAIFEQRDVVEDVIEPFLIQSGLIGRTPRGRVLSEKGWRHLGGSPAVGHRDLGMENG